MGWKPDETIRHHDGTEHHIRRRRAKSQRGEQSFVIRIVGADRVTREVWHEVMDHAGTVIHRHCTYRRLMVGADGA